MDVSESCLRSSHRVVTLRGLILALAVAVVIALGGGSAHAASVKCGDTITTDTTLHHNLVDCPNNGLLIGANGITLNLNGHTIDGDGSPAAGCDPKADFCDVGVVNFGYDGVTVKHGSVRQFAGGVNFGEVHHTRLLDISASANESVGIQLFNSSRSLIRGCSGSNSLDRHEGVGLGFFTSRHIRVLNCTFRHNAHGIFTEDSAHNLVKGNVFSRNSREAILMEGGKDFQISHNRLLRNGGGINLGPGSRSAVTEIASSGVVSGSGSSMEAATSSPATSSPMPGWASASESRIDSAAHTTLSAETGSTTASLTGSLSTRRTITAS